MPLYNFQKRFVPMIKDGTKFHTIRSIRKYPAKPGDTLHLYTGLRTKYSERLLYPQTCTNVKTIFFFQPTVTHVMVVTLAKVLTAVEAQLYIDHPKKLFADKTHKVLSQTEKNLLAWHDGFRSDPAEKVNSFDLMARWWSTTHQLPFAGHIIYWK